MKRVLSLIIILITLCVPVHAENNSSTRQELCITLAKAFELKSDRIAPLIRYNDWFYVGTENRLATAAVINNKLFMPKSTVFLPNNRITSQDISLFAEGLNHYVKMNPDVTLYKGKVFEKEDGNMILTSGSNRFTAKADCPYIDENITTLGEVETTEEFMFAVHKTGKVYIAFPVLDVNTAEYSVVKAKMFLFNFDANTLIASDPSLYENDKWVEKPNEMYLEEVVHDTVIIVNNGIKINKWMLNTQCLDKDIYLMYNDKNELVYIQASEE